MKLSSDTLALLKNFATINPNIVVGEGNVLKTISEAKNILATANVAETFPTEFGVYDLNEFLSIVSMFEEPELSFDDNGDFVVVKGADNQSVKYYFSDPSILTKPQKDITMPACEVQLNISDAQMSQLRRAAGALSQSDVVIIGEEGSSDVTVQLTDVKNATANTFDMVMTNVTRPEGSFKLVFNINNFKFVGGDMEVNISSKLISQFVNKESQVTYWVALEKNSTFGG